MSDGLSNRQAGKLAGCSHVAIAKAIEHGHLPTLPSGKISPAALEKWSANRRAPRAGNPPLVTASVTVSKIAEAFLDGGSAEAAADAMLTELTVHGIFLDRKTAELHRDSYIARLRKLEYEREAGKVIEVEHVAKIVGDSLARVRTRLLAIPAEQAPRLHRCKTVGELQDALLEVITEALEELVTDAAFGV